MADFSHEKAYHKLAQHEGGYVDDPDDLGGETYAGISRVHHPDWHGWAEVDRIVAAGPTLHERELKDALFHYVQVFYKENYWDAFRGDLVKSQAIANKLLDIAVNMGRKTAVEFLQRSLNLLNRNGVSWEELVEDGLIGRKTLSVLNAVTQDRSEHRDTHCVLVLLNGHQLERYMKIMRRSPVQERFARGWLLRIELPEAA